MEEHRWGLPGRQMLAMAFTNLAQGVMLTMPFTLSVFMVRAWAPGEGEERVGRLTGALAAAYALAQATTSYAWGVWSSRRGRKPVMVIGSAATTACLVWFGLAGDYSTAVAARAAAGLLNGIIAAWKSAIGESADARGQARALGLMSLSWGVGCVVGPAVGGAFSQPCGAWPGAPLCGEGGLLRLRPYFLPCLIAAVINALSFLACVFLLEETLPDLKPSTPPPPPAWPSASAPLAAARGLARALLACFGQRGAAYARLEGGGGRGGEKAAELALRIDSAAELAARDALASAPKCGSPGGGAAAPPAARPPGLGVCGCASSLAAAPGALDALRAPRRGGRGEDGGGGGERARRMDSSWLLRAYRGDAGPHADAGSSGDEQPRPPPAPPSPSPPSAQGDGGGGKFYGPSAADDDASGARDGGRGAARGWPHGRAGGGSGAPEEAARLLGRSSQELDSGFPQQQHQHQQQPARAGGQPPPPPPQGPPWHRDRAVLSALLGYSAVCLLFCALDELTPIFASAPRGSGGLGMSEAALAAPLAFGGAVLIAFSLLGYPPLQRLFGTLAVAHGGLVLAAAVSAALPLPSLVAGGGGDSGGGAEPPRLPAALLGLLLAVRAVAQCCAFTSAMILVNTLPHPAQLGAVNGAGQTLASLVRGLGPLLGGAAWGLAARARGGQFAVFGGVGAVALAGMAAFAAIPPGAAATEPEVAPRARRQPQHAADHA
ncbi:MFS general substrate transporter [Raphidocelis subcapitata]|uniref:MFS general substrate transporter n=1 Tax=Raphidocelis subcapitata TaxID=307507 RepID=A0A2V0PGR1_9CHLO|nr:MFS general substrate transporter [Raphidocelis subcapitata]|eukprot:GBF96387.1 MFS general substrate transporter [Raphidocelis subcapitata]